MKSRLRGRDRSAVQSPSPVHQITDFDYDLPKELIAQYPLDRREDSRMMIVRRREGTIEHSLFREFPNQMKKGDVLVLNDTKVIPARTWGKAGEREAEFLFVKERTPGQWEVLCRPAKRIRPGDRVIFGPGFEAGVTDEGPEGLRVLLFEVPDVIAELKKTGFAPLPPYIKRLKGQAGLRPLDLERYQTVYARQDGAIAAPTAGLHFTAAVFKELMRRGVEIVEVTLDVGLATFQPVRVERIEEHRMLEERYAVSAAAAGSVNKAVQNGRSVTAVGTTVVRTLESASSYGKLKPGPGVTSLFIRPGYEFQIVDKFLTNFHLPKSTLLMLVSAFAGQGLILQAYREAVRERYRFFSYGDCMLIL